MSRTEHATEAELRRAHTITPVDPVEEPTHPVSYELVSISLHQRRGGGSDTARGASSRGPGGLQTSSCACAMAYANERPAPPLVANLI